MEFILKYFTGTVIKESFLKISHQDPEQSRKYLVALIFHILIPRDVSIQGKNKHI